MSIKIECDSCRTDLDNGAETYCESCYNILEKEIEDLKEELETVRGELKLERTLTK